MVTQRCTVCLDSLPVIEFYKRGDTGKTRSECKSCFRAAKKKSCDNPIRKKLQQSNADSLARARRYSVFVDYFPLRFLAIILEAQDYRCNICGDDIKVTFTLDHKKPLVEGGGHYIENIQFLCGPCNSAKNQPQRDVSTGRFLRTSNQ